MGCKVIVLHDLLGAHVNDETEKAVLNDQRGLLRLIGVSECHAIKLWPSLDNLRACVAVNSIGVLEPDFGH